MHACPLNIVQTSIRPAEMNHIKLKSRLTRTAAALAIASSVGACAIVPLDQTGQPVAVSPAEAAISTAVVTVGVLHFLGAFTYGYRGGGHRWRGGGRRHGAWGRGGRRHR